MNKITEIEKDIFLFEVLTERDIQKLISLINEASSEKLKNTESCISQSDYYLNQKNKLKVLRPYFEYLWNALDYFKLNFPMIYGSKSLILHNYWFQKYSQNDNHDWHTHRNSNFANVVFLKGKNMQTEILGKNLKNVVYPGTMLTFPAFLKHRSKQNNFNQEKIIISFNSSIE